MVSFPMILSDL